MRTVRTDDEVPEGAVRLVGVLGGQPLDDTPADAAHWESLGFTGEIAKTLGVVGPQGPVVLVGLGDTVDFDGLVRAAGAAARTVPATSTIATSLHHLDLEGALEATIAGLMAGAYRFDAYRSSDRPSEGDIVLVGSVDPAAVEKATIVSAAVCQARDWVNRPAMDTAPEVLASEMATDLGAGGYAVEVWDKERILAERLGGLIGVAAGSERPPRMVVARLRPPGAKRHLALAGKGIVFDSGGLSIKSSTNMEPMKRDMAGAAAVAAAAGAIARLGIAVEMSVFIPLTDNMPSGSAMKPGDVVTARNGKTIEVLNTDAEGRLVLADALALAAEENPDLIVDLATLTGAAKVALGDHIAALFPSDDVVAAQLKGAAESVGERVWHMPMPADYRRLIDSPVADMKNTGGPAGGAITAALLLAEFTGDTPWAHLDIAGPAWLGEDGPTGPKGGSGFGVRTLVALASELARAGTSSI